MLSTYAPYPKQESEQHSQLQSTMNQFLVGSHVTSCNVQHHLSKSNFKHHICFHSVMRILEKIRKTVSGGFAFRPSEQLLPWDKNQSHPVTVAHWDESKAIKVVYDKFVVLIWLSKFLEMTNAFSMFDKYYFFSQLWLCFCLIAWFVFAFSQCHEDIGKNSENSVGWLCFSSRWTTVTFLSHR